MNAVFRTLALSRFPTPLALLACLFALSSIASAEVERIEIQKRDDLGSFERLIGRVHFAIDPWLAVNQAVTDIAFAPLNADGKVEFSSDVMLIRSKNQGNSRGTVFLEIVNRGGPQSTYLFSGARGGDPSPERWDLGDRFILEQGFTMVFLGWQFDVPEGRGLGFQAPTVPVTGIVRESYVGPGTDGGRPITFGLTFCAADSEEADARLTFRSKIDGPGTVTDRRRWRFIRNGCAVTLNGNIDGTNGDNARSAGTDPGLYEVVYHAKNPVVAGLGLAAVRDFASYLKYGGNVDTFRENPASTRRVIGYGYSQSGRFLRQFIRDGFNQDEKGRAAFDGLMISSAGAGGASINHRFAIPGQAGNSVLSIFRPVDLPPFTDAELLAKANAARVTPRIFYTFSSTEYWARAGSLTHTSGDGTKDVEFGPRSRLYFLAGTPHSSGAFPPRPEEKGRYTVHYTNFAQQGWVTRALLLHLDAWIASGVEPPPSRYPALKKSELVELSRVRFPKSPAISFPDYLPRVWRMDYGPEFLTKGIITNEPPLLGKPYTVLVPQVDGDGNDMGGIRSPEVAVPLGTFTGWNIRLPQLKGLDYLAGLLGSFEPFPKTREERARTGDSRKSIEERYRSRQDYLDRVQQAAQDLLRQRYLLPDDIPSILHRAGQTWDAIMAGK
jgi:hypothetical protein